MKHYQIHVKSWVLCTVLMLLFTLSGCSKKNNSNDISSKPVQDTEVDEVTEEVPATTVTVDGKAYSSFIATSQLQKEAMAAAGMTKLKTVYNIKYQTAVSDVIQTYQNKGSYSLQNPLMILNPYGTNTTGMYVYFTTETPLSIEYTVSVTSDKIPDFTRILYTNQKGEALTEQEGLIIGLVPGEVNTLTLNAYDTEGTLMDSSSFEIYVEDFGTVKETILSEGSETDYEALEDGLFVLFGYDRRNRKEPRHLLFYDNYGVIRAEIPIHVNNADFRIETVNGYLLFPCSDNQFVLMSPTGEIKAIYQADGYIFHHDFAYSATSNKLVVLANKASAETKEDYVLTLDLTTGQWNETLDFKPLLPGAYARAIKPEKEKKLDWIHLNTIMFIDDSDVIVSSRELSSIIRVNDIYTTPYVEYIIAEKSVWDGTGHEDLLLDQIGDFPNTGGQHTVTYMEDPNLPSGQYYLSMFNNNYGISPTWKSFDWSVIDGIGLYNQEPAGSYYYKYLIDPEKKTYELVDSFLVPYSRIVASTQHYGNHIIVCSGVNKTYGEYTSDGVLLAEYKMDVGEFTYRAMKYSMNQFWFNQDIASDAGTKDADIEFAPGTTTVIAPDEVELSEFDDYSSSESNRKGNDYSDFE